MSTLPPPATQKDISAPSAEWSGTAIVLLVTSIVFTVAFHVGAGYLSYQKYGSIGWAILDVFFAVFYYPFYAFFLASAPAETSTPMMGGMMKGLSRMLAGKRK